MKTEALSHLALMALILILKLFFKSKLKRSSAFGALAHSLDVRLFLMRASGRGPVRPLAREGPVVNRKSRD